MGKEGFLPYRTVLTVCPGTMFEHAARIWNTRIGDHWQQGKALTPWVRNQGDNTIIQELCTVAKHQAFGRTLSSCPLG